MKLPILTTCLLGGILCASASADIIDVQFYSADTVGYPPASATSYTGPAVVGASGDFWNSFTAASANQVALKNVAGSATAVGLSYSSATFFNNPANQNGFGGTEYQNLMDSYVYVTSAYQPPLSFSLKGLEANARYSLYFYSEANVDIPRQMTIDLNGTSQTTLPMNATLGTFIRGQNYLEFDALADSSGNMNFTLSSSAAGNSSREADLNGFQLVGPNSAAPEPELTGALGCALLALFLKAPRSLTFRRGR